MDEIKVIPLVVYRDGKRIVIGDAVVQKNGFVSADVFDTQIVKELRPDLTNLSIGWLPPEKRVTGSDAYPCMRPAKVEGRIPMPFDGTKVFERPDFDSGLCAPCFDKFCKSSVRTIENRRDCPCCVKGHRD
jgi:hypothetical protein